jgi:hypothetical protein
MKRRQLLSIIGLPIASIFGIGIAKAEEPKEPENQHEDITANVITCGKIRMGEWEISVATNGDLEFMSLKNKRVREEIEKNTDKNLCCLGFTSNKSFTMNFSHHLAKEEMNGVTFS